ncbi:MAG: hypothetical protein R3A11_08110 [Bdellovibrionota bacterium]
MFGQYLHRQLQFLYGWTSDLDIQSFLTPHTSSSASSSVLFRQNQEDVEISIVLRPKLFSLARRNNIPSMHLADFCELVEEISHFTYLTFCLQRQKRVSLLDLELQGEIDKYLLSSQGFASEKQLFERIFERSAYRQGMSIPMLHRYQLANHLGGKFIRKMGLHHGRGGFSSSLLQKLRWFYRRPSLEKWAHIEKTENL